MTGLYVHIPFCSALCPYCDFAVIVGRLELHERYVDALLEEAKASGWSAPFDTVFIGGGTPSLMDAALVTAMLEQVRALFDVAADAEVTLEANPESVDEASMRALREAGVNRVSIGAQSFAAHVLARLGRTHSPADIGAAVGTARAAGHTNISLDLIYGTPGETDGDWEASVRSALALGVDHLSCYALTIEERTAFGKAVARGELLEPEQDVLADRYELAGALLEDAGFEHYEISNWAQPGFESRHNLVYWTQGDYLGLGLGAHSHRQGHRWWNTRSLKGYLAGSPIDGEERLDERQRAEEWLHLRLRLVEGVDVGEAERRLGRSLTEQTEELANTGLASVRDGRLTLTTRGMLLENEVALRLLDGTRPATTILSTRHPRLLTSEP